jgi:hypothetical protein
MAIWPVTSQGVWSTSTSPSITRCLLPAAGLGLIAIEGEQSPALILMVEQPSLVKVVD